MNNQYLYIVISRTQTRFARCIRRLGSVQYNHSAIGLDEELKELYAFSRPQHRSIFLAHLVRETLDHYTLNKDWTIPVVVFRIPVSQEKYDEIRSMIQEISCDPEYMYNLFSVLTYPITHGFATHKAFNCTEFVAYILKKLNYPLEQPAYRYKPDALLKILQSNIIYEGDLRDYMICKDTDEQYFERYNWNLLRRNFRGLVRIFHRTYLQKNTL